MPASGPAMPASGPAMPASAPLVRDGNHGWSAGFRNMLRKENARWWSPKSLAVQLIVWAVLINGFVAVTLFLIPPMYQSADFKAAANNSTDPQMKQLADMTPQEIAASGLAAFFSMMAIALIVGPVILAHDSILKERESGTAAWLLSKPLSRKAFVLSKVLACGFGFTVVVILAQGAIAYAMCSYVAGSPMAPGPFLAALGILVPYALFSLFLAMATGAFSTSRAVALGVPIFFSFIGGDVIPTLWSDSLYITPWGLGKTAMTALSGAPLASTDILTIASTVAWIVVLIGAALWRFERTEL